MNETAFPPPPPGMFVATVSMIHSGRCFHAGEPMRLSELSKIPVNLRKPRYLKFHDAEHRDNGDSSPRNLIYETNTRYSISPEGDRHHQRQIARQINLEAMRIEAEEELAQQVKDELEHPDEQIKSASARLNTMQLWRQIALARLFLSDSRSLQMQQLERSSKRKTGRLLVSPIIHM